MNSNLSDAARGRRLAVVLVAVCLNLTACLSYQRQGDHAFEEGHCGEALEFYDRAAEEGTKDPEMFRRAAQCALDGGDFAAAERYYSQALRYGADLDVARELADFYVKTSNYASAVRVYQYLLQREGEKQPIYNNLGTALMYAGHHFDAEPYLMIAQQMDPKNPTPYLNLAVLYDRHLRQPWLAINFYECFAELSGGKSKERITQRVGELRAKWGRLYQKDAVKCGEAYQPRAAEPVANLEEALVVESEDEEATTRPTTQPMDVAEEGGEPTTQPIEVETMVSTEESRAQERAADRAAEADERSPLQKASAAFEDKRWADTISLLSSVPLARLGPEQRRMLGLAYLRQSNWSQASHWLDLARQDDDAPEVVEGLLTALRRSNEWDRVVSLCKKYSDREEYEKITGKLCKMPSFADEK